MEANSRAGEGRRRHGLRREGGSAMTLDMDGGGREGEQ